MNNINKTHEKMKNDNKGMKFHRKLLGMLTNPLVCSEKDPTVFGCEVILDTMDLIVQTNLIKSLSLFLFVISTVCFLVT